MTRIEKENLYPLLFVPIYKERVWGGDMLQSKLGRDLPAAETPIGEAWEISDRDDAASLVADGPLQGQDIHQLIEIYGRALLGEKFTGGRFPLLIKLIDAGKRLSLQVHPDEAACQKLGDGAEPKTEMWYVIAAREGAKIMAGMSPHCTRQKFLQQLHATEIEDCLQVFNAVSGDAYFISSGRIHAIGAGNLLLEIQQNSDTTYRVSDWGRLGSDGKPRELHVEQALESIHFTDRTSPRITGVVGRTDHNRKFPLINRCPFFQVDDLRLVEEWPDRTDGSSFHIITPINAPIQIRRRNGDSQPVIVETCRSCLIPANYGGYLLTIPDEQPVTVIRTSL